VRFYPGLLQRKITEERLFMAAKKDEVGRIQFLSLRGT